MGSNQTDAQYHIPFLTLLVKQKVPAAKVSPTARREFHHSLSLFVTLYVTHWGKDREQGNQKIEKQWLSLPSSLTSIEVNQ